MKEKKQKERKLSKAELKRKAEFEQLTERLIAKGYKPNHITMSVFAANVFAILAALPLIILLVVSYFMIVGEISFRSRDFGIAYLLFLVLIFVHEALHGITWGMFAENGWKSISFGFIAEYLTPYCTCNQPLKKYQILTGSLMPTIILGVGLGIVSICTASPILLLVSALNICGGGADVTMSLKLLLYKSSSKDVLFMDHPYEVGTVVFEK